MAMKTQQETCFDTMVSALTARTQLGQILKRVKTKNERFIIGRRGQPQAVVMSIDDYIDTMAPAPDWLKSIWADSKKEWYGQANHARNRPRDRRSAHRSFPTAPSRKSKKAS